MVKHQAALLNTSIRLFVFCLAASLLLSSTALEAKEKAPSDSVPKGYLVADEVPSGLKLLAAPPVAGSAAYSADEEEYRSTRKLRGTIRWNMAVQDADLSVPDASSRFACTLGVPLSPQTAPQLYDLLLRVEIDARAATVQAKNYYQRVRPFIINHQSSCTPAAEPHLRKTGSYPSAHATIGWTWALVLAEVDPQQAENLLAHGLAFGQSRVICGAHWQSDVMAGRILASAVVAGLHAKSAFRHQVEAARNELAALRAQNLQLKCNCSDVLTATP